MIPKILKIISRSKVAIEHPHNNIKQCIYEDFDLSVTEGCSFGVSSNKTGTSIILSTFASVDRSCHK